MKQAILDTDTVSYYFRRTPIVVEKVDTYLKYFGFVNLSIVTYYEVMNGLLYKDSKGQLEKFERFVELNHVIPLTLGLAKSAVGIFVGLRKEGITIGHNDVMIAACALENGLKLITNNISHYVKKFITDASDEKIKKANQMAWEAKNFEIENYWKRANYFWAFQVASFAGYFSF